MTTEAARNELLNKVNKLESTINTLVGIVDESDIVQVMHTDEITREARFKKPVGSVMTRDLDTVQVGEPLEALIPLFDRDRVAIVLDGETFVGLITRSDLINHLSLNR